MQGAHYAWGSPSLSAVSPCSPRSSLSNESAYLVASRSQPQKSPTTLAITSALRGWSQFSRRRSALLEAEARTGWPISDPRALLCAPEECGRCPRPYATCYPLAVPKARGALHPGRVAMHAQETRRVGSGNLTGCACGRSHGQGLHSHSLQGRWSRPPGRVPSLSDSRDPSTRTRHHPPKLDPCPEKSARSMLACGPRERNPAAQGAGDLNRQGEGPSDPVSTIGYEPFGSRNHMQFGDTAWQIPSRLRLAPLLAAGIAPSKYAHRPKYSPVRPPH